MQKPHGSFQAARSRRFLCLAEGEGLQGPGRGVKLSRGSPPPLLAPLPVSRGLPLLLAALRAPAATWGRRRQRRGRGCSAPSGAVPSPYPGARALGGLWGVPRDPPALLSSPRLPLQLLRSPAQAAPPGDALKQGNGTRSHFQIQVFVRFGGLVWLREGSIVL